MAIFFCKYPPKSEYSKINDWSKRSSEPSASWKSFKITLLKEAGDYEQGIRRMKRAFSDTIIESSNIDDHNSSEEEEDSVHLTGSDLQKSLNKIPSLEGNFKSTDEKCGEANSDTSVSSTFDENKKSGVDDSDISSSTSTLKVKETFRKHKRDDSQNAESSVSSSSSSSPPSPKKQKTQSAMERSVNSNSLQILSSERVDNATETAAASEFPSKSFFRSMKQSIEYTITEEAKQIKEAIAASNNSGHIEKIMQEGRITDLPKNDLNSFLQFEDDLKNDEDLIKKVKCFMVLNIKNSVKLSENFSIVIPRIITKNVQCLYSAFGRETNGVQKLNFSKTETYKYFREVLLTKCPELQLKEMNSQLSRWFSGAKDREGGKRDRSAKKLQIIKETGEEVEKS